ncbi:MAG: DNA polymerase, partial [Candidatus Igneacidithiobacillus chanchocoensis]
YFRHKIKENGGKGQLAEAFRQHLDPHLTTALSLLSARGDFDLDGKTPTAYLASLAPAEQDALKKQYKTDRQAAKAVNFGLIYGAQAPTLHAYGIASYGLAWALEDAESAVRVFFDLYPELALWQTWTDLRLHYKIDEKKPKIFVADYGREEIPDNPKKIFISSTLSGKPTISHKLTSGLNYQDQGSGAEMILDSIANLESPASECLVNLVHDELVFDCPEDQVELTEEQAEKAMRDAAEGLLAQHGIPIDAESAVGDYWIH